MQIYAINGSPRQSDNTATILQNALDGAAEFSPEVLTETINLYDYEYKGCISCFECKRIGAPAYGKCAVKDEIQPVMQNVLAADAVIFGSPIYYGRTDGMMRRFLERLFFPCWSYDKDHASFAPKKLAAGFVYTMNVPKDVMLQQRYPENLEPAHKFAAKIWACKPRILYVNYTYQFNDYRKYKMELYHEADKAEYRKLHFPIDCQNARDLGAALIGDVMGEPEGVQETS